MCVCVRVCVYVCVCVRVCVCVCVSSAFTRTLPASLSAVVWTFSPSSRKSFLVHMKSECSPEFVIVMTCTAASSVLKTQCGRIIEIRGASSFVLLLSTGTSLSA